MKKLLVAAMGIAAAYGAFADPFSVGKRFEDLTVGDTVTTNELNEAAGGTFWTDPVSATNTYTVKTMDAYGGSRPEYFQSAPTKSLEVKTTFGNPLSFNFMGDTSSTKTIGEDGLYFDSLVKFTVCDTAPDDKDAYNNAKIMMWLQSDDDTVTNVMIKAGYLTYSAGTVSSVETNYTCYTVDGAFADSWHRVTIKAIADITSTGDGVPGFVVFIDGDMVNVLGDYAVWGDGFPARTAKADYWEDNKALFPSMVQSAGKGSLSAIGFDGTGYLTDVTVTENAPTFAEEPAAPEVAVEINGVPQLGVLNFAGAVTAVNAADYTGAANPSAKITLSKDAVVDEAVMFTADAEITLDFAGFVLTNELADAIITNSARSLVITNSTGKGGINCTSTGAAIYQTAATFDEGAVYSALSITGGNFWGDINAEDGAAKIAISGGAFKQEGMDIEEIVEMASDKVISDDVNADGLHEVIDAPEPEPTWETILGPAVAGAYQIDSLAKLKAFQAKVGTLPTDGETFELTTDIALDAAWEGIGIQNGKDIYTTAEFDEGAFRGTFDGQNHTISGFQMIGKGDKAAGLDYCGFFNSTYGATIQNLKIQYAGSLFAADTTASTLESGATFVGVAKNSTLRNLTTVAGTVSCSKGFGGIVGYLTSGSTVDSCTNNLNMTSLAKNKCGGIAMIRQGGSGSATIRNCQNNGTVTTGSSNGEFGGIVGYIGDDITIDGCESTVAYKLFHRQKRKDDSVPVVTMSGVNKGNATALAYTSVPADSLVDNLKFATVDGGVATFVADNALAAGNTYKVMATGATATYAFTAAGTIAFDTVLATPTFTITAAEGLELSDSTSGTVTTYTAVNQYTITYTDTDGTAFTDWADNYAAPTTFTATRIATLPTASDVNVDRVGVEFAGWTNSLGNAVTTTEGLSANLEVFAKFNSVGPVTPTIDPATSTTVEVTASTKQDAIDAVAVAAPAAAGIETAEEKAAYKALFDIDATNKGGNTWDVEIKDIKEQVKIDVAETAEAIVSGTAATGTVTVPKGLYYKVTTYTTLGGTPTVAIEPVLSTGAASSEITKPGTTQGFIKVEMATTAAELAD